MTEKVFISSTCYDLIDLRAEIEKELRELQLTPILSDSLTSEFEVQPDKNSIETCLVNVRKSNVVVIILSQRYGGSLEKVGYGDISATHLEYKTAIENNIPVYFYVRDRFEADYNTYEDNPKAKLKWVKEEKDKPLFAFFKEHEKLSKKKKTNNWYYPFSNSIELKERLRIDLKKYSGNAILANLTKNGQSPCVTINLSGHWVANSKKLFMSLELQNIGNTPAIEPKVFLIHGEDYEKTVHQDEYWYISEPIGRLRTMLPAEVSKSNFEYTVSDGAYKIDLLIEVRYTTITGHHLSDITSVQITVDSHERKITETTFNYNTKKYYHSAAIKHLTKDQTTSTG